MYTNLRTRITQHVAIAVFFLIAVMMTAITGCKKDDDDKPDPKLDPLEKQVRVQVAYDATNVAFKFVWKSQSKTMPAGFANVGKKYPGQFHDMLKHNGTKFDRLASGSRMEEDRVTLMIDKYDQGIPGFAKATCAMACHTDMNSHHLLTDNVLDHWHWRGGRSGPMGYAEDAAINNVERIRDNTGTPPTKFIRSGGDRLREDQAAMAGTGHGILVDGLPRFVFNKGKVLPGNYTIPGFFLSNESNTLITDPYNGIPNVKDLSKNRSLLVIYQDKAFDPVDKVNAIDVAYLIYVALAQFDHLPAHLQDAGSADFTAWANYWAAELGVATNASAAALAKLDAIHQEWVGSSNNAMVTRSVGFIYNSDQHDITSTNEYDATRNEWTVILYRKLSTGSNRDADLGGLSAGNKYAFSFAMHDIGGGSITHDISMPYVISNDESSDIQAKSVDNVASADWVKVPYFDTYYVKHDYLTSWKWTEDWLKSGAHPGSSSLTITTCITCHQDNLYSPLLN